MVNAFEYRGHYRAFEKRGSLKSRPGTIWNDLLAERPARARRKIYRQAFYPLLLHLVNNVANSLNFPKIDHQIPIFVRI